MGQRLWNVLLIPIKTLTLLLNKCTLNRETIEFVGSLFLIRQLRAIQINYDIIFETNFVKWEFVKIQFLRLSYPGHYKYYLNTRFWPDTVAQNKLQPSLSVSTMHLNFRVFILCNELR